MPWSTSGYVSRSVRTNGAMYVSNELNACAPAHSFCIVPRKFTICPIAELKCLGGADSTFPGTPLSPSSSSTRRDQPAQYPASMSKSWMCRSPSRCALPISAVYTCDSQ